MVSFGNKVFADVNYANDLEMRPLQIRVAPTSNDMCPVGEDHTETPGETTRTQRQRLEAVAKGRGAPGTTRSWGDREEPPRELLEGVEPC